MLLHQIQAKDFDEIDIYFDFQAFAKERDLLVSQMCHTAETNHRWPAL